MSSLNASSERSRGSKSASFRILSRRSPLSKLWHHNCSQVVKQWWAWSCGGFKVTCSRSQSSDCMLTVALFVLLFSAKCVIFCHWPYHYGKDEDLLKAEPTMVSWEGFEPDTAPVQAESSNHYTMLPMTKSFSSKLAVTRVIHCTSTASTCIFPYLRCSDFLVLLSLSLLHSPLSGSWDPWRHFVQVSTITMYLCGLDNPDVSLRSLTWMGFVVSTILDMSGFCFESIRSLKTVRYICG